MDEDDSQFIVPQELPYPSQKSYIVPCDVNALPISLN